MDGHLAITRSGALGRIALASHSPHLSADASRWTDFRCGFRESRKRAAHSRRTIGTHPNAKQVSTRLVSKAASAETGEPRLCRLGVPQIEICFARLGRQLPKGMTALMGGITVKGFCKPFDHFDKRGRFPSLPGRRFPWSWHRRISPGEFDAKQPRTFIAELPKDSARARSLPTPARAPRRGIPRATSRTRLRRRTELAFARD